MACTRSDGRGVRCLCSFPLGILWGGGKTHTPFLFSASARVLLIYNDDIENWSAESIFIE